MTLGHFQNWRCSLGELAKNPIVKPTVKPYRKMFNSSQSMHGNLIHFMNITKLNSYSKLGSCISFEEQCISVYIGPYTILVMFLVTTGKKPHSKIHHGSLTILTYVSTCHHEKTITWVPPASFTWHGLGNLIIFFTSFDIFRLRLLQFVNWKVTKLRWQFIVFFA